MNIIAEMDPTRRIFHEVRGLLTKAQRSFPTNLLSVEQCLESAVIMLTALSDEPDEPSVGCVAGGLAPWQILRVKALIEARLGGRLSATDLATAVRLSKAHFARAFRKSFNDPPHLYLMKRRIARAKQLMSATQDSLAEIALDCGLADQAHLSRIFRRLEGNAPNAWRRRVKFPSPGKIVKPMEGAAV